MHTRHLADPLRQQFPLIGCIALHRRAKVDQMEPFGDANHRVAEFRIGFQVALGTLAVSLAHQPQHAASGPRHPVRLSPHVRVVLTNAAAWSLRWPAPTALPAPGTARSARRPSFAAARSFSTARRFARKAPQWSFPVRSRGFRASWFGQE